MGLCVCLNYTLRIIVWQPLLNSQCRICGNDLPPSNFYLCVAPFDLVGGMILLGMTINTSYDITSPPLHARHNLWATVSSVAPARG